MKTYHSFETYLKEYPNAEGYFGEFGGCAVYGDGHALCPAGFSEIKTEFFVGINGQQNIVAEGIEGLFLRGNVAPGEGAGTVGGQIDVIAGVMHQVADKFGR